MEPEKAKAVDWKRVEKDYRAGIRPLRDIAEDNGITEGAIRKRAKRDEWSRDLTDRIRVKAREKVALKSVDEMSASGFVYVIYIDSGHEKIYKIGMAKRFDARFDQHQCSSPFDICVAVCYFTGNMRLEERTLHAMFTNKHVRGERFRLDDSDFDAIAMRARLA
jgi:hypothetical protein